MRTTRSAAAAAVTLSLLVAACGGDNDAESSTGAGGETTEATRGEETVNANCTEATGDTVKVLVILDESEAANIFQPEVRDAVAARTDRLNCDGGIAGSPVELDFCATNLDPNAALECARRAIEDESYIAAAASLSSSAETAPLFAEAGLPNIPAAAFLPGDFASETTFNTNSGVLVVGGIGAVACNAGFEDLKEIRNQLEASVQATALINSALQSYGCDPVERSFDVAPGSADVSSQVTAASDGVDAVVLDLLPTTAEQVYRARQQLGITVPFVGATAEFTNATLASLAGAADGSLIAGWYPTDDVRSSGNTAFLDDLAAADSSDSSGDAARGGWVALDLIATAAADVETADRASLLEALNGISGYDAGGMTPPLDFTAPGPNPGFPRIFNVNVVQSTIEGGELVALDGAETFLPVFRS